MAIHLVGCQVTCIGSKASSKGGCGDWPCQQCNSARSKFFRNQGAAVSGVLKLEARSLQDSKEAMELRLGIVRNQLKVEICYLSVC